MTILEANICIKSCYLYLSTRNCQAVRLEEKCLLISVLAGHVNNSLKVWSRTIVKRKFTGRSAMQQVNFSVEVTCKKCTFHYSDQFSLQVPDVCIYFEGTRSVGVLAVVCKRMQQLPLIRSRACKRTQHVTSNDVGSCWPTTLRPFVWGFTQCGHRTSI